MSNFLTYNKWPLRRVIGAILVLVSLALAPQAFAEAVATGNGAYLLGQMLGMAIWSYILFRLLKAPDEPKSWKGIPHALMAFLLYFTIVFFMASSIFGKMSV